MYGVRSFVGSAARSGNVFGAGRALQQSPKRTLASRNDDNNYGNSQGRAISSTEANVDVYASRNHEFSESRSRDILDYGQEHTGSQGVASGSVSAAQGIAEMSSRGEMQSDTDRADIISHNGSTAVSLNSCMQSNVPEPFNPQGRNPTHVNMPGGGILRSQKYVYGDLHRCHPSKQFSTSALRNAVPNPALSSEDFNIPSPQGIQGDDCVRFKIWYQNCRRFNLSNCDEQLSSLQSGRKTLAQVFAEQDSIIREVVVNYEQGLGAEEVTVQAAQEDVKVDASNVSNKEIDGMQGLQDVPVRQSGTSVDEFLKSDSQAPSPEGIQGSDCERFRVWLQNCSSFGMRDCQGQFNDLQTGRKTLSQIFQEQDKLLDKIARQHRRSYSTGPAGKADQPSENTSDEVSEGKLSQRQKLQRAVKQYGATVVVFHVGISLMSLGGFYMAVSSGIDVVGILAKLGLGESVLESRLATGASTFVVAYAVHKVFAPVRIAITLTSTPFIVRYLRSVGFLRAPKV